MMFREGFWGDEDLCLFKVFGEGVVGVKMLYFVNDRRLCYFNFNLVNKEELKVILSYIYFGIKYIELIL